MDLRKRIQQLAKGKFEYARPLLQFSTDKVTVEVLEGKDYTGDFVITSANRVPMRGVIYTSDPRIECLTPQFEGEEVRIRYQFHSNGLSEGDIHKGDFFILCSQGEYNLSFVAVISCLYADSSTGRIKTLADFTRLAKEEFREACRLYFSTNFRNIIKKEPLRERLLYQGLSQGTVSDQKVEEFLVSTHRKKAVQITISDDEREYYGLAEDARESVTLQRDQWGYIDIAVEADGAFLQLEKHNLTEDDFIGSICTFYYYIKVQELHAGKNFGCVRFWLPQGELRLLICASQNKKDEALRSSVHREIKDAKLNLVLIYMDYRLKKLVTGMWAGQTVKILEHLMAMEPDNKLYELIKAQALIINRQRQEASWIMDDFKRNWQRREDPIWGYYLYLCTLMEREPSYVDRVTEEIEHIFDKNPGSPLLFWVLLFVRDEYYRDYSRRWKAIERWVAKGNHSPFFYLEAYHLIWQNPYLLGHLNRFEIEVLTWARKQNAISRDIALQVMDLISEKREFVRSVFRILESCYEVYPEDDMLTVICSYLIKGQQFGTEYHRWYEMGIEHELRITSLYEAYMMSLDGRKVESVPKVIQMYFQYNSNLPYQQKAVLLVNIIAGKTAQPEVYIKYKRAMEQFAMEQMEAGHISDNLAVIYGEMLRAGVINGELARRLAGILFTHRLICLHGGAAEAVIWQRQLAQPQRVAMVGGTAYFQAYSDDYCVTLLDNRGNVFAESIPYQDEALMNPDAFLEECIRLAPDELPYILYLFRGKREWRDFSVHDSKYFDLILDAKEVSESYKAALLPEIIRFYQKKSYDTVQGGQIQEKYLEQVNYEILAPEERRYFVELMAELRMYEKGYRMVLDYGYEGLDSAVRVALCSYAITAGEFEDDDFLLGFTADTFRQGKYNDVMLIFLCKYYDGATKNMAELWRAAGEFQIDTFDLEERIITQMLFTTEYTPYIEKIYESYYAGGGREQVCLAYLSYFANGYLIRDVLVPEHVFVQIEERYRQNCELNDTCLLGLFKFLANHSELQSERRDVIDGLLERYTCRGICFEFYRRLETELIWKYQLFDKFFVEYHAAPGQRILIHHRMGNGAYQGEDLTEVYDGIYVKEFILFFGESVQYYITETEGTLATVTESACISNQDVLDQDRQGRFVRLNEMLLDVTLEERERLRCHMKEYDRMQKVTENIFRLL